MTKSAEHILEEAMALNAEDRLELIDRLTDTLEPRTDLEYTAAWEAEIHARILQVQRGEATPIPWQDAVQQIGRGEIDDG